MKILVPSLGESVTEATVAKWLKNTGETVSKDEVLVELETDKATLEVYAQSNGVLSEIYIDAGQDVEIGAELAEFLENETIDSNKVIEEVELKSNAKNETKKNKGNCFAPFNTKLDVKDTFTQKALRSPDRHLRHRPQGFGRSTLLSETAFKKIHTVCLFT